MSGYSFLNFTAKNDTTVPAPITQTVSHDSEIVQINNEGFTVVDDQSTIFEPVPIEVASPTIATEAQPEEKKERAKPLNKRTQLLLAEREKQLHQYNIKPANHPALITTGKRAQPKSKSK